MRPRRIVWTLSFFLLFATFCGAQAPAPPVRPPLPTTQEPNPATDDADEMRQQLARDMAKKASQTRQAAIKADTDKLLKLAVELKDYVDKSNENVLSLDVVKKAEEIEKLAHSVKDKMKGPS